METGKQESSARVAAIKHNITKRMEKNMLLSFLFQFKPNGHTYIKNL